MQVLVLTISDRASAGVYEDKSGPAIEEVLRAGMPDVNVKRRIVSDDPAQIEEALRSSLDVDCIVTTGGTGIGPRDVTPDVTEKVCDRMLPGMAEILRSESYRQTPNAMLSRGVAGMSGSTLIVNVPGSERGARFCAEILVPALKHAGDMLKGQGH